MVARTCLSAASFECVHHVAALRCATRFESMLSDVHTLLGVVSRVQVGIELDQHPVAAYSPVLLPSSIRNVPPEVFSYFEIFFFGVFGVEFLLRVYVYRCAVLRDRLPRPGVLQGFAMSSPHLPGGCSREMVP